MALAEAALEALVAAGAQGCAALSTYSPSRSDDGIRHEFPDTNAGYARRTSALRRRPEPDLTYRPPVSSSTPGLGL